MKQNPAVPHAPPTPPGRLELVEADLLGGEAAFAAAFRGCRYVFHCASPFFIEAADPQARAGALLRFAPAATFDGLPTGPAAAGLG